MNNQLTHQLLMIRPACFGFNPETAPSNTFQHIANKNVSLISTQALAEFDAFAETLKAAGLEIFILQDTPEPAKPDAIFPNNWFSTHSNGTLILYPMLAINRRLERNTEIIEQLKRIFHIKSVIDLSPHEREQKFLEGTGSMVLDRENSIAYACISPRTNSSVMEDFCRSMDYKAITFEACDQQSIPVYHTNVLMALGDTLAVICTEAISSGKDKVIASLSKSGKKILEISYEQMNQFAGNMLFVKNKAGEKLVILSNSAFDSLSEDQLILLGQHAKPIIGKVPTIETHGGGSVRCMLAEIFLVPVL